MRPQKCVVRLRARSSYRLQRSWFICLYTMISLHTPWLCTSILIALCFYFIKDLCPSSNNGLSDASNAPARAPSVWLNKVSSTNTLCYVANVCLQLFMVCNSIHHLGLLSAINYTLSNFVRDQILPHITLLTTRDLFSTRDPNFLSSWNLYTYVSLRPIMESVWNAHWFCGQLGAAVWLRRVLEVQF